MSKPLDKGITKHKNEPTCLRTLRFLASSLVNEILAKVIFSCHEILENDQYI